MIEVGVRFPSSVSEEEPGLLSADAVQRCAVDGAERRTDSGNADRSAALYGQAYAVEARRTFAAALDPALSGGRLRARTKG